MKDDLILIVGSNGMVGGELVRRLTSEGYRVRQTTSQNSQVAADKVYLNLVTGEGVNAAMEGVDRAFFLSPPGFADQYALLSPLIQEAKRRGLKKVVLMTAMGANADETSPFRRAELDLEHSGLAYNIIRPNWFMQNFHTYWVQGIRDRGQILLPAGTAKVSFIDARDIAATAFALLIEDKFNGQAFDLTGGESLDHSQVAEAISKATGRTITYEEISADQFLEGLKTAGLPKDYAQFLGVIMSFLKEGYSERRTTSVQDITGQSPRTFLTYANEFKNAFSK